MSAFKAGQTAYWLKNGTITEVVITRVTATSMQLNSGEIREEVLYKTNRSNTYDVIRCTDLFEDKRSAGMAMLEMNGLELGIK